MAQKDYYAILQVARDASPEDIKKAYRKQAHKFHPDKNPGDSKAEARFKEITEAHDVLGDPRKRQAYDQFGQTNFSGGPRNPFERFSGFGHDPRREGSPDLSDLFGDFFASQRRRKARGADLRYTVEVSLEEAALGCEKTIHFVRLRDGKEETARLAVNIPAGVSPEKRLKLKGEGDGGTLGGPHGDLYVIVQIAEHPHFFFDRRSEQKEEHSLRLKLPISFIAALLGTEVEVPTLTGKVSLQVPPGTRSGKVFRLKGKGLPRLGADHAGDLFVEIVIDVPAQLTDQQKAALLSLQFEKSDFSLVESFHRYLRERNSAPP